MTSRLLIADDHDVVREGLRMILEAQGDIQVVGLAVDGRDAVAKSEALKPDIAIIDITMPGLNGIEATDIIRQRVPSVKVLILSMHYTSEHVFRALKAGAWGYILKETAGSEVVSAVRALIAGRQFFGSGVEAPLRAVGPAAQSPLDSLSRREREVLQLVVEGKTSAEIAEILVLSSKSVETYRSRLMQKLGIRDVPSLVKLAIQHGITPLH